MERRYLPTQVLKVGERFSEPCELVINQGSITLSFTYSHVDNVREVGKSRFGAIIIGDDGTEYEITSGHWPRALRVLEAQKGAAK